jgi:hypothetical protein
LAYDLAAFHKGSGSGSASYFLTVNCTNEPLKGTKSVNSLFR